MGEHSSRHNSVGNIFPRLLAVALCALLLLIGFQTLVNKNHPNVGQGKWKDRNSLTEIAKRTKDQGSSSAEVAGPIIDYPGVGMTLEEALRDYSAVMAETIKSQSYIVDSDGIRTWYKFRISERLSTKNWTYCYTCPEPIPAPQEFLPLSSEEFLIATDGGTVNVDGVNITVNNRALPSFESGKKYLLFVSISPSGLATLGAGPSGVFRVTQEENLEPINRQSHPLANEMEHRFNLQLTKLKASLRN